MIIDTHVHYNMEPLFSNEDDPNHWKEQWTKAQEHDVQKSIIVGTDYYTSYLAVQLASKEPNLFATVGCHPILYHESFIEAKKQGRTIPDSLFGDLKNDIQQLAEISTKQKVVAIGETGLDYYRLPKDGEERTISIELQKKSFVGQIEIAQKLDLPLIIHVRDKATPEEKTADNAYWDALEILEKHDVKKFTLHCVSGPLSYVKVAIEMGGYMGFDGNITYPKAEEIREIFKIIPANRRLLETDAPFLPPQEFRGKTCEPWMIEKTAEYIENQLKADRESFAQNAIELFPLIAENE